MLPRKAQTFGSQSGLVLDFILGAGVVMLPKHLYRTIRRLVQHGVNGLIVHPFDPIALVHALISLQSDPGLRRKMKRASGELFKNGGFSPEEVAEQHLSAYQQALNLA